MAKLGFGKGGTKKFKVTSDEPEGWPDAHSFEAFEHTSYANMKVANDIIESVLRHHGIDAYNHPFTTEEPEPPVPARRRKRKAKEPTNENEDVEDENDNSVHDDDEEEELVDSVSQAAKKRKTCPYEQLRGRNIAERRAMEQELGIIPHSKDLLEDS